MNSQKKPDVEYLTSERMRALPFSEAVRVGPMLYLSGQIGVDSSMKLVSGGITPETLNRECEIELHLHYDRQGYWADEPAAKEPKEDSMKVRINKQCMGDRNCNKLCPEVFEYDEDQLLAIVKFDVIPEQYHELVGRAARECVPQAIEIEE